MGINGSVQKRITEVRRGRQEVRAGVKGRAGQEA